MFKKLKRILPIMCACLLLFGSCLTVCAASECPTFDASQTIYANYVVYYNANDDAYYAICADSIATSGTSESISMKYIGPAEVYVGTSNGWSLPSKIAEGVTNTHVANLANGYYFVDSTIDIVTSDGETVFMGPVPPMVAWVEPIPEMTQNQATPIVIIAVGLLASLVGLTVLSRKLPVFLKR